MSFVIEQARREEVYAKIGLVGPSGSGKTMTALLVAQELTDSGNVLVIDTENKSSSLYAGHELFGDWNFNVGNWEPPYSPTVLTQLIAEHQNNFDCIVIDSMSATWSGPGGALESVERASKGGNQMAGWRVVTPQLNEMMDTILRAKCHIILNMRAKQVVDLSKENGKTIVRRLGLQAVQRDTVLYDLTMSANIGLETHALTVDKSRVSELADRTFQPGHGTKEFARKLKNWLDSADAEKATDEMESQVREQMKAAEVEVGLAEPEELPTLRAEQIAKLMAEFEEIKDSDDRTRAKTAFVQEFGRPDEVLASKYDEALEFATELVSSVSE